MLVINMKNKTFYYTKTDEEIAELIMEFYYGENRKKEVNKNV